MFHRRRFKQSMSLNDRLIAFAKEARERAEQLPAGLVRDDLLKKARQAETTSHLDDWINSPGLQHPR